MINIRRAEHTDADYVFAAETAYIDCPWTLEQIRDEIARDNTVFLVAEEHGELIGYASCEIVVDCCDVNNIAVSEKYRRQGVASALLTEMESLAKDFGATESTLTVREDNTPAIKLYEATGYVTVHIRRGYYKGKNGMIMTKKF